jgi:FAD:protein FMN transferase
VEGLARAREGLPVQIASKDKRPRELRFRAMGSDVHVLVVGGPRWLADRARNRVAELEQRWSRFIPDSEVNWLSRRAGSAVTVSADTVQLVAHAVDAWRVTDGAFDPTVLGDVIRAGYDDSFEHIPAATTAGTSTLRTGCDGIEIDGRRVRLPAGTGFDPGGIGKGLAADLVATETLAAGADGVCINLGGDVRVQGAAPVDGAWTIAIEHPWSARPLARVGLSDGAVCTSTTLRRRWQVDGTTMHHVIDPSTGRPTRSDLSFASVVAGSARAAEVLAKSVLLARSERAFDLVERTGAAALAVDVRGGILTSSRLGAFLGDASVRSSIPVPPEEGT